MSSLIEVGSVSIPFDRIIRIKEIEPGKTRISFDRGNDKEGSHVVKMTRAEVHVAINQQVSEFLRGLAPQAKVGEAQDVALWLADETNQEVLRLLVRNEVATREANFSKIQAIKAFRSISGGCSLKFAKCIIEGLFKFNSLDF